MTPPLLIGNWKSNTSYTEAVSLVDASLEAVIAADGKVWVGVTPPFPWLMALRERLGQGHLWIGAQNCSATEMGAYTGEVTASMLKDCVTFVIVGHSERRAYYGETDDVVRAKVTRVLEQDLHAVLCVGEVLEQRQAGDAEHVVKTQLLAALEGYPEDKLYRLVVAYEPVWAIGTGVAATAEDAEDMCAFIRGVLNDRFGDSSDIIIQYGGSANEKNAAELLAKPNVGGLLIGGASLKPDAFAAMIQAAVSLSLI
ncbi:MAG: triose-phosphate isomerase [Thermomicrobiales bacterium]|nr:triose-phosphate isomerase [Thermomicrobiales bacterium]